MARQKAKVSSFVVLYIGSWYTPVVMLPMECQSMMMCMSSSVAHCTAWSSSLMYSIGVLSRHATGCTGIRSHVVPISFTWTKWFLFQCPCISSLSGSEMASPRNSMDFPSGSTNRLPLTEINGSFLASVVKGRVPAPGSRHQVCILCGAAAGVAGAGGGPCANTATEVHSSAALTATIPVVLLIAYLFPLNRSSLRPFAAILARGAPRWFPAGRNAPPRCFPASLHEGELSYFQ